MPIPDACPDSMILPPQSEGRRLFCQLGAGHRGLHSAKDPDGRVQRTWPRADGPPILKNARAASGADR